jgi:putative CocE/NonD family hydrolase
VSDGTKLAMDLYRPKDKATGRVVTTPLPVLWMHTPYNRRYNNNNRETLTAEYYPGTAGRLVKFGYVVATVDFRGLYASYGHNEGYNRGEWITAASRDAYDITEWLARQPWSNGNIGMWGCSATGGSQMQAATTAPPHLKALFPMSCEFDVYAFRAPGGMTSPQGPRGGARASAQSPQQLRDAAAVPVDADTDGSQLKAAIAGHAGAVESEGHVPYRDSVSTTITDPKTRQWWISSSPHTYLQQINAARIPMYMAANWDEGPTKHGNFFTFNNATSPRKLIIGPGRHCDWLYVEKATGFDITVEERRFFDHWLKGVDNGVMREDPVYYYTYNAPAGSEWRSSKQWPLPNEKRTRYYLAEGALSTAAPSGAAAKDEATVSYDVSPNAPAKGLVYETAPLGTDLQVTGHPVMNLWISSTATDGDFIANIQDVAPDGKATSYNITGQLRASLRKLYDPPYNNLGLPWHRSRKEDESPLVPGQPAELVFPILPGSIVFKAGHRLRLAVSFADRTSPRLDPAPKVTIYRDSAHKSYLTLPVIETK